MRRSRGLGVAVAAALALASAACAGIPTSGPVVAGPAVDEVEPQFVFTPNGPVPEDDPIGILSGFMLAVRAPQTDYGIARQFLTPDLALSWDPNAGVIIRSDSPVMASTGPSDAPVLDYSFSTSASVDAAGRYRESAEAAPRSLEFEFEQVDGQWRISAAPNGIVLTANSFARAFRAYALYFFDPSGRYLVPDVRWFAARPSTPGVVVDALLAGPDEWLKHSVFSAFPQGTTRGPRSVVMSGGRAVVDLSAQAAGATARDIDRMHQQLVATLDVADVTMTAEGVPLLVQPGATPAAIDPQPEAGFLLGTAAEFGRVGVAGIEPIPGVSATLVADGATSAVLSADGESAAYLAGDGTVRLVAGDSTNVIDARPGLVAPGLDEFGWTWSGGGPSPLDAFDPEGAAAGLVPGTVASDASVVSLAVSRDSTRLAVGFATPSGPRLLVFGIVRVDGAPTALDPPLELPVTGSVVSVAWVDDRSLVVVTEDDEGTGAARIVPLGAPTELLGTLPDRFTAVGGRGGVAGVRVLSDGVVLAAGGGDGWIETGYRASYLGVQQ